MDDNKTALTDRLWLGIGRAYKNNKTPFLAALFTGLLAHGFAFTNKLLNHDEIESLFGKGATVHLGPLGAGACQRCCFPTGPCRGYTGS